MSKIYALSDWVICTGAGKAFVDQHALPADIFAGWPSSLTKLNSHLLFLAVTDLFRSEFIFTFVVITSHHNCSRLLCLLQPSKLLLPVCRVRVSRALVMTEL